MKITELTESTIFNQNDFIDGKDELNFDLSDDLLFFINNDDKIYRKHLHPIIIQCVDRIKDNKLCHHTMFKPVIKHGYKIYIKKFPLRQLHDDMDDDILKDACMKLYSQITSHINDGHYDDDY